MTTESQEALERDWRVFYNMNPARMNMDALKISYHRGHKDGWQSREQRIKDKLLSEEMVGVIAERLARHFSDKVRLEFPSASVVPSHQHHLDNAHPIAKSALQAIVEGLDKQTLQ